MKINLFIIFILLLVVSCSPIKVKVHNDFTGPIMWEATDGELSIFYYKKDCPFPEEVLNSIAKRVKYNEFDWKLMKNKNFSDKILSEQCVIEICRKSENID